MSDLRGLVGELPRVALLTPEQALAALEELAVLRAALLERAKGASPVRAEVNSEQSATDRLLTAQEVAVAFGCSVAWVYRQAPRWPFTRKLSHKVLRFSEAGLREWLAKGRRR